LLVGLDKGGKFLASQLLRTLMHIIVEWKKAWSRKYLGLIGSSHFAFYLLLSPF